MHALVLVLAASTPLVDLGWQPMSGGGHEVIIQMSSEELARLTATQSITQAIPAGVQPREFRVTLGDAEIPQDIGTSSEWRSSNPASLEDYAEPNVAGLKIGWKAIDEGGHEFLIQMSEALRDQLREFDLTCLVPPQLDVRRYRLSVGTGDLPRLADPAQTWTGSESRENHAEPTARTEPLTRVGQQATNLVQIDDSGSAAKANERSLLPNRSLAADRRDLRTASSAPPSGNRFTPSVSPSFGFRPNTSTTPSPGGKSPSDTLSPNTSTPSDRVASTAFGSSRTTSPSIRTSSPSRSSSVVDAGNRPWLPLMLTLLLLFCSMGGNLYLGWVAHDSRERYRALLDEYRAEASTPA